MYGLTGDYEVVSKDGAIGYALLPNPILPTTTEDTTDDWAVMNRGAWTAAKNYQWTRPETGTHEYPSRYTQPVNKNQYYSPYHPNTIPRNIPSNMEHDTIYDTDTHTLLWIRREPDVIPSTP